MILFLYLNHADMKKLYYPKNMYLRSNKHITCITMKIFFYTSINS